MDKLSIKVLDQGFVELIDWMPKTTDPIEIEKRICDSARTSTLYEIENGTGKTRIDDIRLIRRLFKDYHTSPFEQIEFTFLIKCPIFIGRQLLRHRTANVNEFSGRYSEMSDEYYDCRKITKELHGEDGIRLQNMFNKQGSTQEVISEDVLGDFDEMYGLVDKLFEVYHRLVKKGVAKEVARGPLPLCSYTKIYFKLDLHNFINFFRLRLDKHAQFEIRVYAQAMYDLLKPLVPTVFECFENFRLGGVNLSRDEINLINGKEVFSKVSSMSNIEKGELNKKMDLLNLEYI